MKLGVSCGLPRLTAKYASAEASMTSNFVNGISRTRTMRRTHSCLNVWASDQRTFVCAKQLSLPFICLPEATRLVTFHTSCCHKLGGKRPRGARKLGVSLLQSSVTNVNNQTTKFIRDDARRFSQKLEQKTRSYYLIHA